MQETQETYETWTTYEIVVVAALQALGLAAAGVGFLFAYFGLPAEGFLGSEQTIGDRLMGACGAAVGAYGLSIGAWEAWRRHRHPFALMLALAIVTGVAIWAFLWAVQGL